MTATSHSLAGGEETLSSMSRSRADERQENIAKEHFASVWSFLHVLGVPASTLADAAQEVFLVAARKLDQIRPGAEKAFLFSTAVHVSREVRRKHAREQLAQDPDDETLEPAYLRTPEDSLDQKQKQDLLMHLLDGLTDELRTAFVLYEIEEQSVAEIATVLEIPAGTVASRVRRAREKFEARLQRIQMTMRGER